MKNMWKIVSYLFLALVAQRAGATEAEFQAYSENVQLAFYLKENPAFICIENSPASLRYGIKREFDLRLHDSLDDKNISPLARDILLKLIRSKAFWDEMVNALSTQAEHTYNDKYDYHSYQLKAAYVTHVLAILKEKFLSASASVIEAEENTESLLQRAEKVLRLHDESVTAHQAQVAEASQEAIPDTAFARDWKKFADAFKAQLQSSAPVHIVMTPAALSIQPVKEALTGMLIRAKEANKGIFFIRTIDTICLSADRSESFWKKVAAGLLLERQTNHTFQVTPRFMDHVLQTILDLTRRVSFKDTYQLIELQAQYLDLKTIRLLSIGYREAEIVAASRNLASLRVKYYEADTSAQKWALSEEMERAIAWREACIEGQKGLRGGAAAATYDPRLRRDHSSITAVVRGTPQKHKLGKGELPASEQTPPRKAPLAPARISISDSDSDDELIARDEATAIREEAARTRHAGRTPAKAPVNVTVRRESNVVPATNVTVREPKTWRSVSLEDLTVLSPAPMAQRPLTPTPPASAASTARQKFRADHAERNAQYARASLATQAAALAKRK